MVASNATPSLKLHRHFRPLALGLIALVCLSFLGLGSWREWVLRDVELRGAETEISNLSQSLIRHADDTVEIADIVLSGLALRLEMQGTSAPALRTLKDFIVLRKQAVGRLRGLFVYDSTGRWLAASEEVDLNRFNNADRDYFRHHQANSSSTVHVGQPIRSRSGGQWILPISKRFNNPDGSFGGVVLATIDVTFFSDFFRTFDLGQHGVIALVAADRVILARHPIDEQALGRQIGMTVAGRAEPGETVRLVTLVSPVDGVERVNALRRSSINPFYIVVAMSRDDILAAWRKGAAERMALSAVLTLIVALLAISTVRRVDERHKILMALASSEAEFRLLAEGANDMVTRINPDGTVAYASPSSLDVIGLHPEQLVGSSTLPNIHPDDQQAVATLIVALRRGDLVKTKISHRMRHLERGEIWVESSLRVTRGGVDGKVNGVIAVTRDVTQHKLREVGLADLAGKDGLTGIANRRTFDQTLATEWLRCQRERQCLSLLMIDVDHFKRYNDAHGHQAGDECLRRVASALGVTILRPADLVARYGGEEFAILLPGTDAAGAREVGEKVRAAVEALALPHGAGGSLPFVTASIGCATAWPKVLDPLSHNDLVEAADRALYMAKHAGRNRVETSPELIGAGQRRLSA
ncbi:diguanylate cyclase domain-containing protein [Phreatobacter aquaticus]|nr:diguanylate cyclase [Phreatobacter aquaticus]